MGKFCIKMKLIIWKNLIIRIRRWLLSIFEVVVPVLFILLITYIQYAMHFDSTSSFIPNTQRYEPTNINHYKINDMKYLFAPENNMTSSIIKEAINLSKCSSCTFRGFKNKKSMSAFLSTTDIPLIDFTGILFNNVPDDEMPDNLDYSIRGSEPGFNIMNLFSSKQPYQADEYKYYLYNSFLYTQYIIDGAFINLKSNTEFEVDLTLQRMPDPPQWNINDFGDLYFIFMPILIMLAFTLVFVNIITRIMEEKCSGIKELMKMMGLETWMLWLGWYIYALMIFIITSIVMVILMKINLYDDSPPMLEYTDGFLLWIFFYLYFTSGICFCFLVSTWFRKPMFAINFGPLIWGVTFLPHIIIEKFVEKHKTKFFQNLILLFPNTCFAHGLNIIRIFEDQAIGLQWSNLISIPTKFQSSYSMLFIFAMLIVDSLIFLILTWYIDNIHPGEYGIAQHYLFPFKRSYWFPKADKIIDPLDYVDTRDEFEAPATGLQPGIQIRKLYKQFNDKMAVNGLNFEIYTNQITVLLGHNGAGKTTAINMITGMISPTSGNILVDGYDVKTNKVRDSLGLCPQYNVHFPDLTVLEHLKFFAMLKGMNSKEAERESLHFLSILNISSKVNERAKALSGGMRRRLSLGIALIGNSKVLILDEPTSGMDPEARREIWNILLSMRGERTILITTHYMEEADILGDRIAIMNRGQLVCYGSPMFLKRYYGTGYVLSILIGNNWNLKTTLTAIMQFVPNAKVRSVAIGSVKFDLPTNDTSVLTKLFLNLESRKKNLNIISFGVSITTMDDVFLQVEKIADEIDKGQNSDIDSETVLLTDNYAEEKEINYNSGYRFFGQQLQALLMKRIQYAIHNRFLYLAAYCIPIGLVFLNMLPYILSGKSVDIQRIFLGDYPNALCFYSANETKTLGAYYAQSVEQQKSEAVYTLNVEKAYAEVADENIDRYYSELITSAEFTGSKSINTMYNSLAIHSPAIALNLIMNALLKQFTDTSTFSISVSNYPLSMKDDQVVDVPYTIINTFPLGITFFIGLLLGFHLAERQSAVKHLQIMSGVSRITYWFSNYIFDLLCYSLVVIIIIIIMEIITDLVVVGNGLPYFILLVILFGFAAFPFSYYMHYRNTIGSVVSWLLWIAIIFGVVLGNFSVVDEVFNEENDSNVSKYLYICKCIPHFSLTRGILFLTMKANIIYSWDKSFSDDEKEYICSDKRAFTKYPCCDPQSAQCKTFYSYFEGTYSIYNELLSLTLQIFFHISLFLLIDYGLIIKGLEQIRHKRRSKTEDEPNLDSDVIIERDKVINQMNDFETQAINMNSSDILLVSNLRKWYKNLYAVRGLNFGVKSGECFGLLGINGAGKTTTFKMITGEIFPTTGNSVILNYSLKKNRQKYLKQIGYCPQFDALNFQLTTRQMLTLFAHLRGICQNEIQHQVDKWLSKFDIVKYKNIQCGKLSGGNKRKLSTAIALIGNPAVIMLDEPTSGVDPAARRNLWNILAAVRQSGQSIVLTSHSMDECEALCDRLSIMVDGQMKCIGDIQYLKDKFGKGFNLKVKIQNGATATQIANLKSNIQTKYVCSLKDEFEGMVYYHITDPKVTVATMFRDLEKLKQTENIIEDFTISDSTLEEVFISFAKEKS